MQSIPTVPDQMFWSEAMKRAIVNDDTVSAGMELLRMNVGFRALPVDRDTKAPIPFLTPRGAANATDDPTIFQQWMALASDAGLGAVPGSNFAIIDDDTGDLDAGSYGLSGTFVERTRRGMHYWARLPESRHLKKSKLPHGTGDLICGHRSYVLMSPTPPYFPVNIDAPILMLPDSSPLWELATPVSTSTRGIVPAACDWEEARDLDRRIREHSMYHEGYQMLHTRDWQRAMPEGADVSESGRDFFLVFEASHFLKDHPRARVHPKSSMPSCGTPAGHNPGTALIQNRIQPTTAPALSWLPSLPAPQRMPSASSSSPCTTFFPYPPVFSQTRRRPPRPKLCLMPTCYLEEQNWHQ